MNPSSARIAALAFAIALTVAACKPAGENNAPATAADAGAPAAATQASDNVAAQITGAGATFIYPLISKWSDDYNKSTGAKVNYQSIGSGGGIAQIKAGTVDFGSSDKPLPSDELAAAGLGQFPSAIGGVVPVVNIEGIEPGKLRLTGPLLADIFAGKIATWNDPAIAAVNPGLALPSTKINIVHRSDGSGTTFNFTNYLSKVSPEWKSKVGEGTSVQWPGAFASLQNAAGNWVQPSAETFQAAAAGADWASAKDFNLVITNATGDQAWPITATNFILMYKTPKDAQRSAHTREFFKWAFENGQSQAQALDYVPLPPALVQQVEAYWAAEFK